LNEIFSVIKLAAHLFMSYVQQPKSSVIGCGNGRGALTGKNFSVWLFEHGGIS